MTRLTSFAVSGIALAAIGAALAPSAQAQTPTTVETTKKFRLKIGAAFPTDGDTGAALSVGGDYDFSKTTSANPSIFHLYVDYFGNSDQNVFGGGVGLRYLAGSALSTAAPYVGAGLGVYATDVESGGSTKTNFGGKVYAGYQFNEGFFGEVDYTILPKNRDINPSAINLRLGYRF